MSNVLQIGNQTQVEGILKDTAVKKKKQGCSLPIATLHLRMSFALMAVMAKTNRLKNKNDNNSDEFH